MSILQVSHLPFSSLLLGAKYQCSILFFWKSCPEKKYCPGSLAPGTYPAVVGYELWVGRSVAAEPPVRTHGTLCKTFYNESVNLSFCLSYGPWAAGRHLSFPSLLLSFLIHKMNWLHSVKFKIPFSNFSPVIMLQIPPLNIDFFWFLRLLGFQGLTLKCMP